MKNSLMPNSKDPEGCYSDNFGIRVASYGRKHFDMTMQLAFGPHKTASHYLIDPVHGFVYLWGEEKGSAPLPFPYNWELAALAAWTWLEQHVDYPHQPSHDGSNSKGYLIYNGDWGHMGPYHYAIVAVKPEWMMHSK